MTCDTSIVVAGLSAWHPCNPAARAALDAVSALPAHVLLESYSVLTRLPDGRVIAPEVVARELALRFPRPALALDGAQRASLPGTFADAGVAGGAAYDGLVGLEARAAGEVLLTLDRRAIVTYDRVGAAWELLAA